MNKQNSIACDNYISTDVGDTLKSYSSKFKQLKQAKNNHSHKHILPIKLQRAAITIQRFWRNRMVLRRKLYSVLSDEVELQNDLLLFQIQSLNKLYSIYEKDCKIREKQLRTEANQKIKQKQQESSNLIKKLVGVSMLMQKKRICQSDQKVLFQERDYLTSKRKQLTYEKQRLKSLLSNEFQEEEEQFMRQIKQQNMELLQATKQRGQLQKQMRQKLVQSCKRSFSL